MDNGLHDLNFTLPNGEECVIRNIPCEYYYEEPMFDMKSFNLLSYIRDLMYADEIPLDVDYQKVKDLE